MLTKENARNLLYQHMHWRGGEHAIGTKAFGELAEAIAQAHEEEMEVKNIALKELDTALERLAALHEQEVAGLRERCLGYSDALMELRKKLYIETGDPKWQRYVDSLWAMVDNILETAGDKEETGADTREPD